MTREGKVLLTAPCICIVSTLAALAVAERHGIGIGIGISMVIAAGFYRLMLWTKESA